MPTILIVDTSVFLNALDVPAFNQNRDEVLKRLSALINQQTNMLLPAAAIIETGNHIAQLADGSQRRRYSTFFVEQVRAALNGDAPWTPAPFFDLTALSACLVSYVDHAMRGVGFGDLSIIKEWESACARHPRHRVSIWSLDHHLSAHDRRP